MEDAQDSGLATLQPNKPGDSVLRPEHQSRMLHSASVKSVSSVACPPVIDSASEVPVPPAAPIPPSGPSASIIPEQQPKDVQSTPISDQPFEDQEWPLKTILFPPFVRNPQIVQVLVQDQNGPCSFLALCNVLILRGDLVLPPNANNIKFSALCSLLAEYLLRLASSSPSSSSAFDFALDVLPKTLSGLDVNVNFLTGKFASLGEQQASNNELALFELAKVEIRHGWLADKSDQETWDVLKSSGNGTDGSGGDYDSVVNRLVEADVLTGGNAMPNSAGGHAPVEDGKPESVSEVERKFQELQADPEKQAKVYQAAIIRRFLDASSTQLTYAGLFSLSETLAPGSLSALFRNSHFSVLYRRPVSAPLDQPAVEGATADNSRNTQGHLLQPVMPEATLFQLVTDQALLHEPSAVWESLVDIDGAASRFYDSGLEPARIMEDWVSREARAPEVQRERDETHDADMALAAQLQQQEYEDQSRPSRQDPVPAQAQTPQPALHSSPGRSMMPSDLDPSIRQSLGVKTGKDKTKLDSTSAASSAGGAKKKEKCIIC